VISGTGTPGSLAVGAAPAADANGSTNPSSYQDITTGVDGANLLVILANTGTGSTPSNYTFISDIGTVALGTYQANTTYTLTVALGSAKYDSTRSDFIGLAASNNAFATGTGGLYANYASVVAGNTVTWTAANFPAYKTSLYDYSVTIDTAANPSLVGQSIGAVLGQLVGVGATTQASGYFDNVRLSYQSDTPNMPAGGATGAAMLATSPAETSPSPGATVAPNLNLSASNAVLPADGNQLPLLRWANLNQPGSFGSSAVPPATTWTLPATFSADRWLIRGGKPMTRATGITLQGTWITSRGALSDNGSEAVFGPLFNVLRGGVQA